MANTTAEVNKAKKIQLFASEFCNYDEIKNNLCYIKDFQRFAYYNDDKNYWQLINRPDEFFHQKIWHNFFANVTRNYMRDFMYNVGMLCLMNRDDYYSDYIALEDCLLNTKDFTFHDFDKNKWPFYRLSTNKNTVMHSLDSPIDPESVFLKFINQIMVDEETGETDPSLVMLVQEMFGYCLADKVNSEKTFFLKGDQGSNGKGVLMWLLQKMIGDEFCSAINLKTLTSDRFAFDSLVGKKINIAEENEGDSVDSSTLKTLVSADAVRVEKKFADSFAARLYIKYIFTTNQMPRFTNFDNALKRRVMIIPFNRHFTEEERDFDLKYKLQNEMADIALWSLQGLKRLVDQNFHFTKSESCIRLVEEEQEDNNSCLQYMREDFDVVDLESEHYITVDDFYLSYTNWCKDSGRKPVSKQRVGKDFSKLVNLKSKVVWDSDNHKSTRAWPLKIKNPIIPNPELPEF